jgi:hypothetical protein
MRKLSCLTIGLASLVSLSLAVGCSSSSSTPNSPSTPQTSTRISANGVQSTAESTAPQTLSPTPGEESSTSGQTTSANTRCFGFRVSDAPAPDGYGYQYRFTAEVSGPPPLNPVTRVTVWFNTSSEAFTETNGDLWVTMRHAQYQRLRVAELQIEDLSTGQTLDCGRASGG